MRPWQRKAWRDLRAGWVACALAALLAALTTCLGVAAGSAGADLAASLEESYQKLNFQDLAMEVAPAPPSLVEEVARIPGVAAVEGRAVTAARAWDASGASCRAQVYGVPDGRRPQVNDLQVVRGSGLAGPGELLMEARCARRHGYRPGDAVTLERGAERFRYRVVGLVVSPEFFWPANDRFDPVPVQGTIVYLGQRDLAAMLGEASVDELLIRTRPGQPLEPIGQALTARLGRYLRLPPYPRSQQPSHALLTRAQDILSLALVVTCTAGLGLGATVLGLFTWRQIRAQRAQIGTLLCLGFSGGQLGRHYLGMAVAVSLAGALPGVLAGALLGRLLLGYTAGVLGLPSVHWGLHAGWMAGSLLLVVGVTLAAAGLAVRPLLNLQPVEALRAEFSARRPGPGQLRLGPVWLRLALRNLLRSPVRALGGLLAITLCVALLTLALALKEGERVSLRYYFERSLAYDFLVELHGIPSAASLPAMEGWPGVERVEKLLRVRGQLATERRWTGTSLWGLPPDCRLLGLWDRQGRPVPPPQDDRLLAGPVLRERLQADSGTPVRQWPVGPRRGAESFATWVMGPELAEPVANPAKVSLARLQAVLAAREDAPPDGVGFLLVKVEPGQGPAVRRRLEAAPQVAEVVDRLEVYRHTRESLAALEAAQAALQALAWLVMVVVVAAVAALNLEEQRAEMETLGRLGVAPGRLLGLRLAESGLVWLGALPLGVLLGAAVADGLLVHFQRDIIQLPLTLGAGELLWLAAVSLGLVVAGTLTAWFARRP